MASGYYPLDAKYEYGGGKALSDLADQLKGLLDGRGDNALSLPAVWDGNTPEDAAQDGGYETYLWLAHELIERCLKRPKGDK